MLFLHRSSRWAYLSAVLGSGLVLAVDSVTGGSLRIFLGTVGFIFAVLTAAALGGWRPGLLTTALCVSGYVFFFIPPRYTFRVSNPADLLSLFGFVVVGMAISALCEGLHAAGARLEERQRRLEREIAEHRKVQEALEFLNRTSSRLAALTDRASALQQASRLMVPFFADWCVIHRISEDGTLHYEAHAHRDRDQERLLKELLDRQQLDWNSAAVCVQAMRSGKTQLVAEMPEPLLNRVAQDSEQLAMIRALEPRSVICVPLRIRERTVGAISFVASASGRRYTSTDVALAEDLSQRVATAVDNSELLESVRAADRQKDEFVAMLAHELRNPLAAINYANSAMQLGGTDSQAELVEMVNRQVRNLSRLIDDLLDMSRISRNKVQLRKERVGAGTIVRRAAAAARPLFEEKRHELVLEIEPQPMPLFADATRVEQMIANLLTNAAKYTPQGGRVSVSASPRDGEAVIKVKDTGIGIPAEILPRVFDLFAQADRSLDRSEGGLGIGLTVARKLAEMHGGTVTAASEGIGKGAEFTLRLPLSDLDVAAADVRGEDRVTARAKLRILVVDDNRDTVKSEAFLLSRLGHEVEVAYDGVMALEVAAAFRPDAVLLDIGLPGIDGYEVARRLRAVGFASEVLIAVSGYGRPEDEQRSRAAGFDRHLVKPVNYEMLVSVLDTIGPNVAQERSV
jgi:signal transduction histidine kinase/ActR/RegA family two-component response regulator